MAINDGLCMKLKKNNVFKFGEEVEGYSVPVLNEREIRATAGIMFLGLFTSFALIVFRGNFLLVKYVIVAFAADFVIRIFLSPRFSPLLIVGRMVVSAQAPEYVGAAQKKFAWKIGVLLSTTMFVLLVILNSYSTITAIGCLVCLVFLFFESAFGICLGCLVYGLLYKKEALHCAGEICTARNKHAIQRISKTQLFVVFFSLVLFLLCILFFNSFFHSAPRRLQEIIGGK